MDLICDEEVCTGCSACYSACPNEAIFFEEKEPLGHLYPRIISDKCVECGICKKVCPSNNIQVFFKTKVTIAAIAREKEELIKSNSGGVASVLSDYIIQQNGVVYGCVQDSYKSIYHKRISERKDLYKLKGSKYVQSQLFDSFQSIKDDLNSGKLTLFIGTPCQVAGLKSFLKKDYPNLLLIDLVCHGVPSLRLLKDAVSLIVKKNRLPNRDYCVSFREHNPLTGKINYGLFLKDSHGNDYSNLKDSQFLNCGFTVAFYSCLSLRKSCYSCRYSQSQRIGDITLGDFWGLGESCVPQKNGVSLVLCNTQKGVDIIKPISQYLIFEERSNEEAVQGNGRLREPAVPIGSRDLFSKLYQVNPVLAYQKCSKDYIEKWYNEHPLDRPFAQRVRNRILCCTYKLFHFIFDNK